MEQNLIILAIWLPLAGFIINGLLSLRQKNAPKAVVNIVGIGSVLVSFAIFVFLTFANTDQVATMQGITAHFFNWIDIASLKIDFAYRLDGLSIFMAWIVTGIGLLIHIYSSGYMAHEDDDYSRFFAYLNLFIFAMLHLILGANLPLLFLGWEGVGLASYLLIGFDHHKDFAAAAGKKAFITNRIGDAGFLIGMFLVYKFIGSFDYTEIYETIGSRELPAALFNAIAFFMFIGAMGKSAQFPLYVWLPDAMAGPTPVSALIHAATMVTAGVFMIARMAPVFLQAPEASAFIAHVGAGTALFAALMALTQTDIKKVLAYSTVSQLGYMFLAMGVGSYGSGLFHLMTHAFFKALLFLGSGAVIIALHHQQDMRQMGGLFKPLKFIAIIFWVGAIAISGIPGFSGFFSKDMILEMAFTFHTNGPLLFGIGFVTAILTSFYIFRLIFLTFHTREDGVAKMKAAAHHHQGHDDHHHSDPGSLVPIGWSIKFPLLVLAILSIVGGYVGLPHLFTHSTPQIVEYFDKVLPMAPTVATENWHQHISGSTAGILMGMSIAVAILGLLFAWYRYQKQNETPIADGAYRTPLVKLSFNKFYVDEAYEAVILKPLRKLADFSYKVIDARYIDGMVDGLGAAGMQFSQWLRRLQDGQAGTYALYITVGVLIVGAVILGGIK